MKKYPVSTIELFFDLVFVFTITQLTHLLAEHLRPEGAFQVALIFIVLFWMYGAFAWLTNQVPPDRPSRQILLVAGMAGFMVCALALPNAIGDDGVLFGVGYLWVVLVHSLLYSLEYGRAIWRFAPVNVVSALMLIFAGTTGGLLAYAIWVAVIAVQTIPPWLVRRSSRFDVNPEHFVERHGLLLIVAIGESIIAIGAAIDAVGLDTSLIAAVVLALALSAGMWWVYFAFDPNRAEHMLASSSSEERTRAALGGYFYAFIPMLLGVVAMAAGITESLGHFTEPLDAPVAFVLSAGVGLYLLGQVAFHYVMRIEIGVQRWIAPIAAVSAGALGISLSAAVELSALVLLLVVVVVAEARPTRQRNVAPQSA